MSAPGYDSFLEFFLDFVLPTRAAGVASLRLDGLSTGPTPSRPIARFQHAGHVWGIDGDTHFEPLEIAHHALVEDSGSEPFCIRQTATRLKLVLRPDLDARRHDRSARNASYLYVYARRPAGWPASDAGLYDDGAT